MADAQTLADAALIASMRLFDESVDELASLARGDVAAIADALHLVRQTNASAHSAHERVAFSLLTAVYDKASAGRL